MHSVTNFAEHVIIHVVILINFCNFKVENTAIGTVRTSPEPGVFNDGGGGAV